MSPSTIPDSTIKWKRIIGGITLIDSIGRIVEVEGDDTTGRAKMQIDIAGYVKNSPQIELKVFEETSIKVSVFIVRKTNGDSAAFTAGQVDSMLDGVNKIYNQLAIKFEKQGAIQYIDSTPFLKICCAPNWLEGDDLASMHSGTGGLELYFVNEIDGSPTAYDYSPANAKAGTVISKKANVRTLAHELGHACGLLDIYDMNGVNAIPDSLVKIDWLTNDWNNGPGPQYYSAYLKQRGLVQRLIMYGIKSDEKIDFPFGPVYGLDDKNSLNQIKVGNEDVNRNANHF